MTDREDTPPATGRYGLSQSLLHPNALTHPASALFTQPGVLAHSAALTGISDRQLTEPELQTEVKPMSWKETLGKMNEMREAFIQTDIGQTLGQEWENARLTIADSVDLRLRSMETLYSRDPGQSAVLHHEPQAPLGPAPEPVVAPPGPEMDR